MAQRLADGLPVAASQTRAVLSRDAVTMRRAVRAEAARSTRRPHGAAARRAGLPVAASQTRAVLSRRRGDDARAVRAEAGRYDRGLMAQRLAERLAGRRVPDPRGLVPDAVTMRRAVRAEAGAPDTIASWRMRLAERLAGRRVPDPRGLVIGRGDDAACRPG